MNNTTILDFTQNLLKRMTISSYIAINPKDNISDEIDLSLRAMLFGTDNYTLLLENSMYQAQDNTIYRFFDEYHCNYIFMKLPKDEQDSFFFIGPYLPNILDKESIMKKANNLKLSDNQTEKFIYYYNSLPIVEDENILFSIMCTLADSVWGKDKYNIEYIDYMIPDRSKPICVVPDYSEPRHNARSIIELEENYANEKMLMEIVSKGQLHKLSVLSSEALSKATEQRLSDSLRNRKNYLIILNTLLRKSAENGGVHPLFIDRLSSSFAKQIEDVRSIEQSNSLQSDMMREYCVLVKKHSLNNLSPIVGKAVMMISYDLTDDLSLKTISNRLNITPSYLSALFRKELCCTLTEYVTQKRFEHAINLLNTTNKMINVIAFECGIQDTNYFIKLFKKRTGLTPTQYRAQIRN